MGQYVLYVLVCASALVTGLVLVQVQHIYRPVYMYMYNCTCVLQIASLFDGAHAWQQLVCDDNAFATGFALPDDADVAAVQSELCDVTRRQGRMLVDVLLSHSHTYELFEQVRAYLMTPFC